MGKSDPYLIPWYSKCSSELIDQFGEIHDIAFFGQPFKNDLCYNIEDMCYTFGRDIKGDLYDIQLGNWDINSDWQCKKYDLIFCFRTFYFAKDPKKALSNFCKSLKPEGVLIFDIGLGSAHFKRDGGSEGKNWTFGWKNEKGRCFGNYQGKKHYLFSSFWDDDLLKNPDQSLVDFFEQSKNVPAYSNSDIPLVHNIKNEFDDHELISFADMGMWFSEVSGFSTMNTVTVNGRNAMYFLFALKRI